MNVGKQEKIKTVKALAEQKTAEIFWRTNCNLFSQCQKIYILLKIFINTWIYKKARQHKQSWF